MDRTFRVTYLLKTALENNGEFSPEQQVERCFFNSVSNDLNEIFTDLFYKHRFEGIVGLEILGVEELAKLVLQDQGMSLGEGFWKGLRQFHLN